MTRAHHNRYDRIRRKCKTRQYDAIVHTLSPDFFAVVLMPETSEPAPGSVTPYDYAAQTGRFAVRVNETWYVFFCSPLSISSVPLAQSVLSVRTVRTVSLVSPVRSDHLLRFSLVPHCSLRHDRVSFSLLLLYLLQLIHTYRDKWFFRHAAEVLFLLLIVGRQDKRHLCQAVGFHGRLVGWGA